MNERRIAAIIPPEADEAPDPAFDREAYRERDVIERLPWQDGAPLPDVP